MTFTRTFRFRFAGLSISAPLTWKRPAFINRLIHPSRPAIFGPGGPGYEFIWFDKPMVFKKIPEFKHSEMANHLIGIVQVRGNRILGEGTITVNNQDFPTITFEKHRVGYAPTTMKRYLIVLNNKLFTIGARLSHNNIDCYSEEGYDKIIQSIKKI